MKEVKIYEEDIQEAYQEGCEDVKETLKTLYPGLKLGEVKEKFYKADELTARVDNHGNGLFLTIILPNDQEITSFTECKDEDSLIWVPFFKNSGIELEEGYNFRIKKRE